MIYFKVLTTLILLLLLTACTTTKEIKAPTKTVKLLTPISQMIVEQKTNIPDISGTYNLVKGSYIYRNGSMALQNKIEASSIIIEKLDENNFGYYYVTKLEGLNTEGYFGGFTYKDGQFYQKVIDYPTTNTTLRDNIDLTSTENSLKLIVNTINAKRVLHWEKAQSSDLSIISALKEERKAYIELFKERLFPTREHISMK